MTWGTVELEPEVRDWLESLKIAQFAAAAFYIDLLAREDREIDRARDALRRCVEQRHTADEHDGE